MSQYPLFDRAESERRRDAAMAAIDDNTDPEWKQLARVIIAELAATGETFVSDDVWKRLPEGLDLPHDRRALGPVMRSAATSGLIKRCGWQLTEQVKSHRQPITQWKGSGKKAAADAAEPQGG